MVGFVLVEHTTENKLKCRGEDPGMGRCFCCKTGNTMHHLAKNITSWIVSGSFVNTIYQVNGNIPVLALHVNSWMELRLVFWGLVQNRVPELFIDKTWVDCLNFHPHAARARFTDVVWPLTLVAIWHRLPLTTWLATKEKEQIWEAVLEIVVLLRWIPGLFVCILA